MKHILYTLKYEMGLKRVLLSGHIQPVQGFGP